MDYMRRTNMTPRPRTQEQATKMIDALTVRIEAIEAERMKLIDDHSFEATVRMVDLGEKSIALHDERHTLTMLRIDLPTQAQYEYEEDMRLQEQIANDPYGGDDFMAYNMMGDCW